MAKAARRKPPSPQRARRACRPRILGQRTSTLAVLPPAERISLRAPAASVAALSKALGVDLPQKPKTSASKGGRTALWLGPDEWLVIDEAGKDPLADCAEVKALHSAVGISHRNVAISVTGPAAAATRQRRLPAGPVARRLPGRRLLAHHPRQGRDRAAAHRRRRLPRRMLALVLRLCLGVPDGSRQGRRSIGSLPPLNAAVENLQPECSRRPSDGWSSAVRAIAVSCASPGRMPH